MATVLTETDAAHEPVRITNREGGSSFVLTCDHASNFLPAAYGKLGLDASELSRHIAWDPGALPVAARMAELLGAPLVESRLSRLLIDCNRPLDAPDLIPAISESTPIPANAGLSQEERGRRIALAWTPFHDAVDAVIEERLARGLKTMLVSIHSFTPIYRGKSRPWQIGIIHDEDRRIAAPMIEALQRLEGINVGINEPYSPADRVYFTLEKHARSRGIPCAMIEIRNDEIADAAGQMKWAELLADIFSGVAKDAASENAADQPMD